MKQFILLTLSLISINWVQAQDCGTPTPSQMTMYPEEVANARGASAGLCIDVFFHIVRNTDGSDPYGEVSGEPRLKDVDEITEYLNSIYSPHNIFINNAGSDFIDNTDYVSIENGEELNLIQINNHSDAINFYIVNAMKSSSGDPISGRSIGIPSNNLVINNFWTMTSTAPHELGHCFSLAHTHETGWGIENIDGSNCQTAGDRICDTPADPELSQDEYAFLNRCDYIGPNEYNPLTDNVMSYSRWFCRTAFTQGQGRRMRMAIANEPILQAVVSTSCASISEVNSVCPSESIDITLTNIGNATTAWTSSPNVQILSSNNTSATLLAANSNSTGDGWVTATLSNGIVFTEEFEVGAINLDPYYIANASLQGSTVEINNEVWNYVDVWSDTNLSDIRRYHWSITATGSAVRHTDGSNLAMVRPNQNWGNIQIGIRVENACGTLWKWRTFNVNGGLGGGRPGQIQPE